ncbi:MAG TPA: hypothetical protein VF070_10845 [Streptosporangiaceae bacterium]
MPGTTGITGSGQSPPCVAAAVAVVAAAAPGTPLTSPPRTTPAPRAPPSAWRLEIL